MKEKKKIIENICAVLLGVWISFILIDIQIYFREKTRLIANKADNELIVGFDTKTRINQYCDWREKDNKGEK